MKYLLTLLVCGASMTLSAQNGDQPANVRTGATSVQGVQSPAKPLPYDVEDKYMGRKAEFLNMLTVEVLPDDFPVYSKEWSLKDYNQVVDAYLSNHKDILKPRVKEKVLELESRNK